MLKRLFFLWVVMALWPVPASAECELIGTLVRVDVLEVGRKGVHTLYAREFQTDPHYYVFKTQNQLIASEALALAAMHAQVEIIGDEPSCPFDGQIRFGGNVRQLTVGP